VRVRVLGEDSQSPKITALREEIGKLLAREL
jgi:hypothetical protein